MPSSPQDNPLHAALRAHVSYLRDLSVFDLYRRVPPGAATVDVASLALPSADTQDESQSIPMVPSQAQQFVMPAPGLTTHSIETDEDTSIAPRKPALAPLAFTPGPLIAPALRAQVLASVRAEIGDCTRCPLGFAGRQTIVFGDGDANARLLFVGEGPGADEDAQGVPFVGRAGQLLNNMITAMGLSRAEVYIANIVKCRPPQNRAPEPVEAHTCSQFLFRQIDIIRPQVIVALGSTAATYLLGSKSPLSALRGQVHATPAHPDAKLIVTYHPAYLLRDPRQKKEAWIDLQLAMSELQSLQ